jgi:two-component system cell cycle sensor histidine kinase/response regulator CckA
MKEKETGNFMKAYGKYAVIMVFVMTVSYVLLYLTYENVKEEMIDNLNVRQMLHAKQAAKGIETFFDNHIKTLQILAKNRHIIDLDEEGKKMMRQLISSHAEEASIITRIDINGRIVHPEPYDPKVISQTVTRKEEFDEVKRTHQIVVSDVFTNRRGFKTIIIHVPVFKGGYFSGSLAILFPFDLIAGRYIDDIRIGKDGYAWIISKNGIELSCPVPGHVGNSVFSNCRAFPDILAMAERMVRGEQGVTTYQFDRIRENVISKITKQAVFMPIRLGNNFWSIVVATPEDEVVGPLQGFRNKLILIAILLMAGTGFFVYMLFRGRILVDEVVRRRKTEEALQASEARYRALIESQIDLMSRYLPDTTLTFVNDAYCQFYGKKRDELIGHSYLSMIAPEFRELVLKETESLVKDPRTTVGEYLNYRHDSKECLIQWVVQCIFDDNGHVVELQAVGRDITDHKRAEQELRESQRRLKDIIEFLPDATLVIDKDGTVIAWNRAIEAMTGVKAEDMLGKGDYEYALPFYGERRPILIDLALHPDPKKEKEYTAIQRTGDIVFGEAYTPKLSPGNIHLSATASVLRDSNSEIIAAIECIRNNTERKRLETQLQQAQKMQAIGTLAGGIAHDFNNLLMAIQGNASLMLMKTDAGDPRYERLISIEDQVAAGAELTKQILGFARVGKYQIKPIDLNDVVEKSASMFGRTRKEILIHKKYEQALWTVEADASQMEQVLMNLFVNAWQAMPGGGHVYLETANRTIAEVDEKRSYLKPGRYVKISMTDTGVGMDEKTKERIFEPFFTTKEMGRGTGLGLAMVYGIVKGHNGYINVYSEEGKGSTFNIYLPASEKDALKEERPEEIILKGKETILLVDDEKAVRDVMKEVLEMLEYRVFIAANGREALKIYEENKASIDLVIVDMIMPDMGGAETFEHLKKINREIKVILSSGYSLNGEAAGIMARGCNGFIQKPATMAELSRKIRDVLRGKVQYYT